MRSKISMLVVIALMSCQTESLSDVSTSEIYADLTATSTGDGTTNVSATFRSGGLTLTYYELTDEDSVTASSGTTSQTLKQSSLLGVVTYATSMPIAGDGSTIKIALLRQKDSGAPASTVTLAPAFTLTPVTGTFSRAAAGPKVSWSTPSTTPTSINITGPCIQELDVDAPAGATDFTVPAGALVKLTAAPDAGTAPADSCDVQFVATRATTGTLDPAYKNGEIGGVQTRTIGFTTSP